MRASASDGSRTVTAQSWLKRKPVALAVPTRELDDALESITVGMRMQMLSMGDAGHVFTTSGLGNDYILLQWGKRSVVIRGSELLRAWVKTFAPEDAARFPAEVKEL